MVLVALLLATAAPVTATPPVFTFMRLTRWSSGIDYCEPQGWGKVTGTWHTTGVLTTPEKHRIESISAAAQQPMAIEKCPDTDCMKQGNFLWKLTRRKFMSMQRGTSLEFCSTQDEKVYAYCHLSSVQLPVAGEPETMSAGGDPTNSYCKSTSQSYKDHVHLHGMQKTNFKYAGLFKFPLDWKLPPRTVGRSDIRVKKSRYDINLR